MKAALYARISPGGRADREPPLANQVADLKRYVETRGWSVEMLETEKVSGGNNNRPVRARVIRAAHQRRIDVIVVVRLDRWGRSSGDVINSLADLQSLGVGFVSLSEGIDLTTPA